MKAIIKQKGEVEVKTLRVDIYIDVHDAGDDFPLAKKIRNDNNYMRWCVDIDIKTGVIKNWPKTAGERSLFEKVVDGGKYYLLDENNKVVISRVNNYVPNGIIPPKDGFGDYIDLDIDSNGKITNWYENPSLEDFFDEDEEDD